MSEPKFILGFVLFLAGVGLVAASGGLPNGGLVIGVPSAIAGIFLMGRARV